MGACGSTEYQPPYHGEGRSNAQHYQQPVYNPSSQYYDPIKPTNMTACPTCSQTLQLPSGCVEARCPRCQNIFRMRDGIPVSMNAPSTYAQVSPQHPYQPPPQQYPPPPQNYQQYNQPTQQPYNGYRPQPMMPPTSSQQMVGQQSAGYGTGALLAAGAGGLIGGMLLEDAVEDLF